MSKQLTWLTFLDDHQTENNRSWIRKNSELTEFLRIQLRIVVYFILPIALKRRIDSKSPFECVAVVWMTAHRQSRFRVLEPCEQTQPLGHG